MSKLLVQPSLEKVREGVFSCNNSQSYLLFVDLEKKSKEEKFHFDDFFEEDYFHWDTQTTQHINSPKIQEIVKGERTPHLFVRVVQKIKSKTQPFVYCGRLQYGKYEKGTSKPVHIIFQNIDYDDYTENENLIDIYLWKPSKVGGTTKSKISMQGKISTNRRSNYKKPNQTERSGLVVSRVGQGYYRQQIIEKWKGQCAITGLSVKSLLIASHIVPWSESNDEERLDPDNGILLSPNFDALFDKHLISFNDDGSIIVSETILSKYRETLGLSNSIYISVDDGMIKYLRRHHRRFKANETKISLN